MRLWQRDKTNRLFRVESKDKNLIVQNSNNQMEDNGSNQGDNEFQDDLPIRTLRDYLQPTRTSTPSCMVIPSAAGAFDMKPGIIQLLPKFHGLDSESPYLHLKEFDEVCSTLHFNDVTEEVVKLKLFPFSLKEKAKSWLHSLRPRTIATWQEMTREFLKKFFPTHKTNTLRRNIMNFAQKDGETFFQCWERFKDLLLACPHHGYEIWRVISFFYDGLSSNMRQFVEMMCNGEFMSKEPNEAWDYFDLLAENAQAWDTTDKNEKSKIAPNAKGGIYLIKDDNDVNVKIANLTRKVEAMELSKANIGKAQTIVESICGICESNAHMTEDCPTIPAFKKCCMIKQISPILIKDHFQKYIILIGETILL